VALTESISTLGFSSVIAVKEQLMLGESMSKDDTAVNEPVAAEAPVTESAPVEANETAADNTDIMEASLDDLTEDEPAEETDSPAATKEETKVEPEAEETTTEPQKDGDKPLAPKSENRFQKLANENKELREHLLRLQSQETQVATEQELMNQVNPETGDYYTPAEAERIARFQTNAQTQQSLAQERYQLEVQQNQQAIGSEVQEIMENYPWSAEFIPGTERLDPATGQLTGQTNPAYNPTLAMKGAELLEQSLIRDPNVPEIDPMTGRPTGQGMVVGSKLSPKQIYKIIDDSISYGATKGQVDAQKATQKMLASVDASPGASQASKLKEDPMLAAFRDEAGL
jgi:hypothetical protein